MSSASARPVSALAVPPGAAISRAIVAASAATASSPPSPAAGRRGDERVAVLGEQAGPVQPMRQQRGQGLQGVADPVRHLVGLDDGRQLLSETPVRDVRHGELADQALGRQVTRRPRCYQRAQFRCEASSPRLGLLVLLAGVEPARYRHYLQPAAVVGEAVLGVPGAAGDVDGAAQALVVRGEEHDEHVGQLCRADAADVGDPGAAVDQHEVVGLRPLRAAAFQEVAEAVVGVEARPVEALGAGDVAVVLGARGNQVQPVVSAGQGDRHRVVGDIGVRPIGVVGDEIHHTARRWYAQPRPEVVHQARGVEVPVDAQHAVAPAGQHGRRVRQRERAPDAALVGVEGGDRPRHDGPPRRGSVGSTGGGGGGRSGGQSDRQAGRPSSRVARRSATR